MGREILFRGKRKSDGEWILGNLLRTDDDGTCIIQNHVPHHLLKNYEVDPETVCQYTGLTDKNGRKIFEGDIIKYDNEIFVIKYIEGFAAYSLRHPTNSRCAPAITTLTTSRMEIIGNIFDHPELLNQ